MNPLSPPQRPFSFGVAALRHHLSLLFRSPCLLCDRLSPQVFCQDCAHRLLACRRATSTLSLETLPPLYSWGRYEGALKQILARLKYDGCCRAAEPLGQWLAQQWLDSAPAATPFLAVPIPLHSGRQQQRGYNQAELIARSFCQVAGVELRSRGLVRIQATEAQYKLSKTDRYQNLNQAFALGSALLNVKDRRQTPPILLIDDIFTTGATLKAATATLHKGGFTVAALLTVALSERSSEPL